MIPNGKYLSYKAEADALQAAAKNSIREQRGYTPSCHLLLRSISTASYTKSLKQNSTTLFPPLSVCSRSLSTPSSSGYAHIVTHKEMRKPTDWQEDSSPKKVFFEEAKTIVKEKERRRWLQQHLNYIKKRRYLLSRSDQVTIVRLRTFQTLAPHVHKIPHLRVCCGPLRYSSRDWNIFH